MIDSKTTELEDARGLRFRPQVEGRAISCAQVLEWWRGSTEFRASFIGLLAGLPYAAYRWETPPLISATADRPFEFVVIDDPSLALAPDPAPFAGHFTRARGQAVITFENLGGDAELVVPCPAGPAAAYAHLAAFVRDAPEDQQHALWMEVGRAMQRLLGDQPVWLSTAGGGVAWLHIRLDDRPKYYAYGPYRRFEGV